MKQSGVLSYAWWITGSHKWMILQEFNFLQHFAKNFIPVHAVTGNVLLTRIATWRTEGLFSTKSTGIGT